MSGYSYIFWTAKHEKEAKQMVKELLAKKWIACASIFPEVVSLFTWEGKVEEAKEAKVILKTKSQYFAKISAWIQQKASYEVSEVLEVPISQGASTYLAWMEELLG